MSLSEPTDEELLKLARIIDLDFERDWEADRETAPRLPPRYWIHVIQIFLIASYMV